MTLTLLTAAGIAFAVVAVYAVITSARPVEALAGETTIASADAAAETLATGRHLAAPTRTEWHLATVSALCDAEDLLDTLENQGVEERELVVLGNSCFAVRWR
ncbi:MAG: hypothetical protein FJ304_12830 [Planctomycetes bacterium]|nr:hypothetical protein [Planctomycetota bacterium]